MKISLHPLAVVGLIYFCVAATPVFAGDGAKVIAALLEAGTPAGACGKTEAAIAGTRARLADTVIPDEGKVILVNIASQILAAYENGHIALIMKVIVGTPRTPTPEMNATSVEFVRFNPTWTVPQSILQEASWQRRADDPEFLAANGFSWIGSGADEKLVQSPGEDNTLGVVKFGLRDSSGVYLHDTSDRAKFSRDRRALSHGCVRLEKPLALAAWVLGISEGEAIALQEADDREQRVPPQPVPVIIGYWTAVPTADGRVSYHADIYGLDGKGRACEKPGAPKQ